MLDHKVKVVINGAEKIYPEGTRYLDLVSEYQEDDKNQILLARADGRLRELWRPLDEYARITFVTYTDKAGFETYRRSMILLMLKALYQAGGFEMVDQAGVHFAVSDGLYITISGESSVEMPLLTAIRENMRKLVEKDIPLTKNLIHTNEAISLFHRLGMEDKEKLFHFRRVSSVNIYDLDGFKDYFYGYMVPSTGFLKYFELYPYHEGFVIQMPKRTNPGIIGEFKPFEKIFKIQEESRLWGETMGIRTVADLNEQVVKGGMNDLILVQEALMEKKIGEIAEKIASMPEKKIIMIAGPSSSGKTTFSHRLSIQLMASGLKPHPIPMDDFFVEREDTPLDENGKPDFECLEAIDIKLFNQKITDLLEGKETELPEFNFKTGKKEYKGKTLHLGKEDVLVIEGIHGLDDRLSYSLPKESKFKIYISALTQLNIDEHNRIPTTDGRLLRRIVRDARTRGTSAKRTIEMWPSVRKGEEAYIFPYQEDADVMINSALIYELAVLKIYAEPLLFSIGRDEPEYEEAKRLLKFLDYFVGIPGENIPNNSFLREFVGGSVFPV